MKAVLGNPPAGAALSSLYRDIVCGGPRHERGGDMLVPNPEIIHAINIDLNNWCWRNVGPGAASSCSLARGWANALRGL
jgi:hypothetical protein